MALQILTLLLVVHTILKKSSPLHVLNGIALILYEDRFDIHVSYMYHKM